MSEPTVAQSEQSAKPSQFMGGLLMGLLLGTAGYYFFGTPQGKKHRQKLLHRWDKIQSQVGEKTKRSVNNWPDTLRKTIRHFTQELGAPAPKKTAESKPKTAAAAPTATLRNKPKSTRARAKFKGI
jgi:hypothetical protein